MLLLSPKRVFIINSDDIPVKIPVSHTIPNKTTRNAMILAKAKELNLFKDDSVSFDDIDKAIKFLNLES